MEERDNLSRPTAVVLNRDLLFGSHIRSALTKLGLEPQFVRSTDQFVNALRSESETAAIGIIDMNGVVDWEAVRETLIDPEVFTPTIAFGPHVDAANRREAKKAGVTRIVSNGQFQASMADLIDRYRRR